MVKIICLKWGVLYGPEYVNRLYNGIKRNCSLPFELHCFTDDSNGIDGRVITHPLPHSDTIFSWWNKIWLFSDEVPFEKDERLFYLDLDTLITGNIDYLLMDNTGGLVMLQDFYWGLAKSATQSASGVMAWNAKRHTHVWNSFIAEPHGAMQSVHPHGDQVFIGKALRNNISYWQDLYPNQIVSFKVHCRETLPASAKIVCFHGNPSIPEAATMSWKSWKYEAEAQPWIMDYWK